MDAKVQAAINVASKTNYINPDFLYLKNVNITEWDIKSAGLSVLKFRKLLPKEELVQLEQMDKHSRTVKEGLLQKNHPEIAEEIINTLAKAREAFVLLNHITEEQILSIKKDAMFLINKTPETTVIKDAFTFRKKGVYTSFIKLGKTEFYYNGGTNELDIKGLSKEAIELQSDYLLKDLQGFLRSSEKVSPDVLFSLLKNYRQKYLNLQLPLETYRELDSGKFRIDDYLADNINKDMLSEIDISQNYMNYILPLIQSLL